MSETSDERAYGCAFCVTGAELAAAQHIQRSLENVRAIVARQLKKKTVHGATHSEEIILYPGYAFFEAPSQADGILGLPKHESILSILKAENGDWRLYGEDAKLVEWLFSYGGLLPLSQACKEGDFVRITGGPLLDLQGRVLRFDKRHQSAQVAVTFCNRVIHAWFQFEVLEKRPDSPE